MRYRNKGAWGALILLTTLSGSAVLAHQATPTGVPSVPAPPQDQTPPPDLPVGAGPSATSQAGATVSRYDEVGYASWYGDELRGHRTASGDAFDPDAITAASRTLPLGSFAEVTALDSGRTVLVAITDRGPHRPDRLIDLSVGAAKLLGVDAKAVAPVRVRQVDPPAADQVALKQGMPAGPRLDSPAVLLAGLRARLSEVPGTPVAAVTPPAKMPVSPAAASKPSSAKPGASYPAPGKAATVAPAPKPVVAATKAAPPAAKPPPVVAAGKYAVQVAAFSSAANAKSLAGRIDGHVIPAGKFWRVELGPFADSTAANRARDGVAKRGYGDARVVRKD
ncbi:septal ring lytic transglycosylase RlpA family protein [Sphingomonas koreensis]|nr:septal ring lytic transglycosylase RlpA family protein [Sphingomonas koreensis]